MIGQGRPRTSLEQCAAAAGSAAIGRGCRSALLEKAKGDEHLFSERPFGCLARKVPVTFFRVALVLLLLAAGQWTAVAETMRVRVEWGGGGERQWKGTISLSQGTLDQPGPLGIEADEPGSMWLQGDPQTGGNRLLIRQRSVRVYDGVDLLVRPFGGGNPSPTDEMPPDAKLIVELTAADDPDVPIRFEVPLAGLRGNYFNQVLDQRGNRLLVRDVPGDRLRIGFPRDSLVFSPGEKFSFTVQPHALPLPAGNRVQLTIRLVAAEGREELWSTEHQVLAGRSVAVSQDVILPQQEGVYDIVITATYQPGWREAVSKPLQPLHWNKPVTLAQRNVQVLVLGHQRPIPPPGGRRELSPVAEDIDPASPGWREQLAKLPNPLKIPGLPRGPLGNDNMKSWQHSLGEFVRLNPSRESPDVSWEAYTLSIDRPGRPYVLEVTYLSDVPQTLGISILEPSPAGALLPIGLDSGVDLTEEITGRDAAPRLLTHRVIFWPRTKHPMVLMSNLRENGPAVYGKIRVLGGWDHLPPAHLPPAHLPTASTGKPRPRSERLMAAYFDRPLFPENFSAEGSAGEWIGRSLDDWNTFYQGGTRLVEYLHHAGYNGLMISVLADGSTIYPSRILEPTPRYDTGVFLAAGPDPVRKDVLEMLFRLFDREGLRLIPTLEFAAPLPELEAIRRQGGPEAEGIEWIGPEGNAWCGVHSPQRGLAPYYNVLHPRVQEAMLRVVREVVSRYRHHPSFSGLAIKLSARGYAQLPPPEWGMDDVTIARFQRDTDLEVPGSGPARFEERAALLDGAERPLWLQWRARELSRFYRRVYGELTAARPEGRLPDNPLPDRRLYLAGAGMLSGPGIEDGLQPALARRRTMAETLLRVGIDVQYYQGEDNPDSWDVVLLRPRQVTPTGRLSTQATSLEVDQMSDVDHYFQGLAVPGSLFFHPPHEARIESFDRKSPFRPTYTSLVAQAVPSGHRNRQRFVHSLATLDAQVMVDGGWMLPLGQEESIRDVLVAYRLLPAVRFHRASDPRGAAQPVTFRYVTHAGRTYAYAVNDAPFAVTAQVEVDAADGCRLTELTGARRVAPLGRHPAGTRFWTVELQPYDLVAVEFSQPGVKLLQPRVSVPPAVIAALQQRIHDLVARAGLLGNPAGPLKVLSNPGFEFPPGDQGPMPDWVTTQRLGVSVEPDATNRHGGRQSVHMRTDGPWACLVSRPFDPPTTGRLSIPVWLRVADPTRQPALRLALEGKLNGGPYYKFARVGLPLPGRRAVPIGNQWSEYVFKVDDLPLQGLSELRVRFDLMGPGEVWVDDVQLFDRKFDEKEIKELSKKLTLAHVTLQNGNVGDCMRLLDGYWPRFLQQHVPLRPHPVDLAPGGGSSGATAAEPPPRTGWVDRMRDILPKQLRF